MNNNERIENAYTALLIYLESKNDIEVDNIEDESTARDLIGDLLHYLYRNKKDLAYELRCAISNFMEEVKEETPNLETSPLKLEYDALMKCKKYNPDNYKAGCYKRSDFIK